MVTFLLTLYVLAKQAIPLHAARANELLEFVARPSATETKPRAPPTELVPPQWLDIEKGNEAWVELANMNVVSGGKVWSVFRRYYGK